MSLVFWKNLKRKPELFDEIKNKFKLGNLTSQVLAARFENLAEIEQSMMNLNLESPFVMADMDIAVERLRRAVERGEKIAIYGDYDCDGVCASVMLYSYLKSVGADVLCHIPDRSEGYGLNCCAIEKLKQEGVQLIVTVDNGIKAVEEAKLIFDLNIDLIITDHHNVAGSLPKANAILNPKRVDDPSKFKHICGAAVVLKLIAAMYDGNFDYAFQFAGDLAAIATIADVVPLTFENRVIVLKGLAKLKSTSNLGLLELLKLVFPKGLDGITSADLAFKVCPIINAAGRVKTASLVFELLVCENKIEAKKKAINLFEMNLQRKKMQQQLMEQVENFIRSNPSCLSLPVLVVYGKEWPSGLLGLVAGALVKKFKKPAVALALEDDLAVGSARSFESFCMFDALSFCADLFLKWGGHNLAGGLTLKVSELKAFILKINQYAKDKKFAYVFNVDLQVKISQLSLNEVKQLQNLEPFGNSNEQPVFAIKNLKLLRVIPLKQGRYLNLEFSDGKNSFRVIDFDTSFDNFYFEVGVVFNVLVKVNINCYCGVQSVSFMLVDLRPTSISQNGLVESYNLLKNMEFDVGFVNSSNLKPTRFDYELVYLKIKQIKFFRGSCFDLFCLLCGTISYFKLFVVLKVFEEFGLIEFDGFEFKIKNQNKMVDLNESQLIKKLFG